MCTAGDRITNAAPLHLKKTYLTSQDISGIAVDQSYKYYLWLDSLLQEEIGNVTTDPITESFHNAHIARLGQMNVVEYKTKVTDFFLYNTATQTYASFNFLTV